MRYALSTFLKFPYQYFFDVDRQIVENKAKLQNINLQNDKVNLFDLAQNYETLEHINLVDSIISKQNIPYIILSPNPYSSKQNIHYFPLFYLHGLYSWPSINILDNRKYVISCLNRNPHTHRKYNYIKLLEKKIPNFLTSFHELEGADVVNDNLLEASSLEKYNKIKLSLSTKCKNDLTINHPAFTNSYCNLVTETVVHEDIFISEKIWKPIVAGQFFLAIGCKGTIKYLQSLGVDVFNDILDHSYDSVDNWMERIDKVHESIDKFLQHDIPAIWKQTYSRRLSNQRKFFKGDFGMHYVDIVNQAAEALLPKY